MESTWQYLARRTFFGIPGPLRESRLLARSMASPEQRGITLENERTLIHANSVYSFLTHFWHQLQTSL